MANADEMPVFGERVEGCPYIVRPSAYALITNADGELAIVLTPRGGFLPGGGIDEGEDDGAAVAREAREECGFIVRPVAEVARAVEIVYSAGEGACFEKRSTFIDATLVDVVSTGEGDHRLVWLEPAAAIEHLAHESHRWAVRRLGRRGS